MASVSVYAEEQIRVKQVNEIQRNMKEKYYSPTLEEFHVNTEYEVKDGKGNWNKCNDFSNAYDYEDSSLYGLIKDLEKGNIRIKHLDREDIESLDWKYYKTHPGTEQMEFEKGEYLLSYDPDFHGKQWLHIEVNGGGDTTLFSGTIKNKSELINQLKRCGI
jgi:hypothetical protein